MTADALERHDRPGNLRPVDQRPDEDRVAYRVKSDSVGPSGSRRWHADPWLDRNETVEGRDYEGRRRRSGSIAGAKPGLLAATGRPGTLVRAACCARGVRASLYVLTGPLYEPGAGAWPPRSRDGRRRGRRPGGAPRRRRSRAGGRGRLAGPRREVAFEQIPALVLGLLATALWRPARRWRRLPRPASGLGAPSAGIRPKVQGFAEEGASAFEGGSRRDKSNRGRATSAATSRRPEWVNGP